jgi:lipopolysaccharide biosynthesis glycosyltransferase
MKDPADTIRIFVGTSEYEDKWIERILVYTLLQNTDRELEITFMRPSMYKDWNTTGWGTPFTCYRYSIPEMCNFKGRAIYMDVDQMNFRDIGALYDTNLGDCAFGMCWDALNKNPKEFEETNLERGWFSDSVILIDCEKAQKYIAPIAEIAECDWGYKNVFSKGIFSPYANLCEDIIIKRIDCRWNSFDGCVTDDECEDRSFQKAFPLDEIWHLHFTSLSSQPWHPKYNPHGKSTYKREDIAEELWRVAYKVQNLVELIK